MRTAIGLRLLLALTLMGWGQFAFAEDYYWTRSGAPDIHHSDPVAACKAYSQGSSTIRFHSTTFSSATRMECQWQRISDGALNGYSAPYIRHGDGCSQPDAVYNAQTGMCEAPKDCINNHNVTLEAICTLDTSAATSEVACPDKVYYDGCSFRRDTSKDSTKCYWDLTSPEKTYRCNVDYLGGYGSIPPSPDPDAIVCNGSGVCTDPAGNESGIDPWDTDTPSANCYMSDGREICRDPEDSECIKVDGSNTCLSDSMNCYYSGLTLQCVQGDKPQRNCTYFNGAYKCFDPKDPSKEIPSDSPDHPDNGGNADGNENNDPKDPGDINPNDPDTQGKDDLATNKSVKDVEDAVNGLERTVKDGFADTNNLLEELKDGIIGDAYDNSGDGNDADAKAAGDAVGVELANAIESETDSILEERETDAQAFLDGLPGDVEGWFGSDGSKVGLANVMDTILPSAVGCSDYTVNFELDGRRADLVIPVCDLTRVKPLLEWVIWCVTLIGLWKILYSSLRQEDVKASKGGF